MKVTLLSHVFGPNIGGGAATSVTHLAKGLRARDIDVAVIATHDGPASMTTSPEGIRIYTIPPRNLYWVENKDRHSVPTKALWQLIDTWNPRMIGPVQALIAREVPDIVHVHKLRGLSPAVWSAATADKCRPVIQTCHDYEVMSPEGTLSGRIGNMAINRAWTLRPYQASRAHLSNMIDVVTAPSRFTLDTVTGAGYFGNARKVVVPNSHGFTMKQLMGLRASEQQSEAKDIIRFLYLGRLETSKGVQVLMDAFARVLVQIPNSELHIGGYGSLENELRRQCENLRGVHFHGAVFGQQKDELIRSCDVVVVPSIWPEVFGIIVVEAYAYGKPVIGSDIGGIPELVVEGYTGYLATQGDAASLSDRMLEFASKPSLARSMSAACFQAAEIYTIEGITDRYLKVYQDALSPASVLFSTAAGNYNDPS